MNREQLIHVLRAARGVWSFEGLPEEVPIGIVGSQSILLYYSDDVLPDELKMSMEVDLFLVGHAEIAVSDWINGTIGEGSPFHATHGIYADGIDLGTITLPENWRSRAKHFHIDLLDRDHTVTEIVAISPNDLVASKVLANRPKDRIYVSACKGADLVSDELVIQGIEELAVDDALKRTLLVRYMNIDGGHKG